MTRLAAALIIAMAIGCNGNRSDPTAERPKPALPEAEQPVPAFDANSIEQTTSWLAKLATKLHEADGNEIALKKAEADVYGQLQTLKGRTVRWEVVVDEVVADTANSRAVVRLRDIVRHGVLLRTQSVVLTEAEAEPLRPGQTVTVEAIITDGYSGHPERNSPRRRRDFYLPLGKGTPKPKP